MDDDELDANDELRFLLVVVGPVFFFFVITFDATRGTILFSILIFLVVGETDEECDARSPARAVLLIDILSSVFSLQVPSVTTLFPLTMDGFVGISAASSSTLFGGLCLCESVSFCLADVILLKFPGGRYTSRFSVSDLCASDREEDNNCFVANDAAVVGDSIAGRDGDCLSFVPESFSIVSPDGTVVELV